MKSADLLLDNGLVVTMDPERRVLDETSVAIRDGRIVEVGPAVLIRNSYSAARIVDCSRKAILPGLVDLHGYLGGSILKSIGEALDSVRSRGLFEFILSRVIDEEYWAIETQLCALDRVKFGTTFMFSMAGGNGTRTDDCAFVRIANRELTRIGMRARIGLGPARPPWPRLYSNWREGIRTDYRIDFETVIDNCDTLLSERDGIGTALVDYCTALSRIGNRNEHDPVWSPDKEIWVHRQAEAMRHLMAKHKVGFWTHMYGNSVEYAHDEKLGLLGPDTILSHCTDLPARALAIMAETGSRAAHHPRVGRAMQHPCKVPEMIEAGIVVGLGSDMPAKYASDLFLDMQAAMRLQRIRFKDPLILPPGKTLEMATIDGYRALGLDDDLGSVEANKKADLITLDLSQPHLQPLDMPVYRIVCHANGKDVSEVIIDGRLVMEGRRMLTIDEEEVLENSRTMYRRLMERAELQPFTEVREKFWGVAR